MSHSKSLEQGEVWLVELGQTRGAEMEKTRPAIVLSDDNTGVLPLRVVVPLTHWQSKFEESPWLIKIPLTPESGLDQISAADTFQIRSISEERFRQSLGRISMDQVQQITQGLMQILGLHPVNEKPL